MVISQFSVVGNGNSIREAFELAKETAKRRYIERGNTGSILEKDTYRFMSNDIYESYQAASKYADELFDRDVIWDENGPAACLMYTDIAGNIKYLFFGWATGENKDQGKTIIL
jgi:hypothetical protein